MLIGIKRNLKYNLKTTALIIASLLATFIIVTFLYMNDSSNRPSSPYSMIETISLIIPLAFYWSYCMTMVSTFIKFGSTRKTCFISIQIMKIVHLTIASLILLPYKAILSSIIGMTVHEGLPNLIYFLMCFAIMYGFASIGEFIGYISSKISGTKTAVIFIIVIIISIILITIFTVFTEEIVTDESAFKILCTISATVFLSGLIFNIVSGLIFKKYTVRA